MKTTKELRAALSAKQAKIKEIRNQVAAMETEQKIIVYGSNKWYELDDQRKALEKQIPALIEETKELTRELARALNIEAENTNKVIAEAKKAISPKIEKIIHELEAECEKRSEEIASLVTPFLPEGAQKPEIAISIQVRNQHIDYFPLDNAQALLLDPIERIRNSLRNESDSLNQNLERMRF